MTLKKPYRAIACFSFGVLLFVLLVGGVFKEVSAKTPGRVLFISSYHPDFPTFFQQIEGIKSVFSTQSIILDIEFMDSKRFYNSTNMTNFHASLSHKLANAPAYDLILTADDNALTFTLTYQEELFAGLPVVFFGVNNLDLAQKQNSNPKVTGVVEAISMLDTLQLMKKLHPDTKRITALVDSTPSGQADLKTFYSFRDKLDGIEFSDLSLKALSFDKFSAQLRKVPDQTTIILLSAYQDKNGKSLLFNESLQLIRNNLSRPVYHLWYHGMGDGVFGGKLISHFEQGATAAKTALDVLNGNPIEDIAVSMESPNRYTFDYLETKRFGIEIDALPGESLIINEPFSFYNTYKTIIWLTAVLFATLIIFISFLVFIILLRRKVGNKLQESEERLELAIQGAELGMWDWHIQKNRVEINERWASMLGYCPGRFEPDIEAWKDMLHPEDRPQVLATLQAHLSGETPSYESQHRLRTNSGAWLWVLDCGRVVERAKDGAPLRVTGVILDVDERNRAAEALQKSYDKVKAREQELEALNQQLRAQDMELRAANVKLKKNERYLDLALEIGKSTIWEIDLQSGRVNVVKITPDGKKRYPQLPETFEGFKPYYTPASWKRSSRAIESCRRGETDTYDIEIELSTSDGQSQWQYSLGRVISRDRSGAPHIMLGTSINITRIKQAEAKVQLAQEQLIQADKLMALGTLVAGVAHEINNPNNFVMLNTPILQDIWQDAQQALDEYCRESGDFKAGGMPYSKAREAVPTLFGGIIDGTRRISTIVKELKDFARPDDVNMEQSVDVNTALKTAVNLLRSPIDKATRSFSVSYADELPPVTGNAQRLEQVFINLIQNACQALPDSARSIRVGTHYEGGHVVITVSDEGRGILAAQLTQIMDPFFTTKRGSGGTGLGLSISSKIVQDHGGRIEVQSREGQGSTFSVHLPLHRTAVQKKILVVDDDEVIKNLLCRQLAAYSDFEVKTAANGTEACITLGRWHPDLIILDIHMPDMHGVDVCRHLQNDPDLTDVSVIICTGFAEGSEINEIRAMGYASVLDKPIQRDILKQLLEKEGILKTST
ncbi:MAG: PAS domain-containing protein [Deltaproteobacteria bacterium]|nr:PAS domain-containing protein [Deltaproteobacteria bacterium]